MTLRTLPVFYYGFEVLPGFTWVDFREVLGPEISFQMPVGTYSADELREILEQGFNDNGTFSYTVTFDRFTRIYRIHTDNFFELLLGTGSNLSQAFLPTIGFSTYPVWGEDHLYGDPFLFYGDVDSGGFMIHAAQFPAGFIYDPQFLVQDYLDAKDNEELRDAAVNESTSGEIEVLHFGLNKFYEFNFEYITNINMPCNAPIRNNPIGVESVNAFMRWSIKRKLIEYMPDKSNPNTFYKIRLEKLSGSRGATSYELKELVGKNLADFYETGVLTFRSLE